MDWKKNLVIVAINLVDGIKYSRLQRTSADLNSVEPAYSCKLDVSGQAIFWPTLPPQSISVTASGYGPCTTWVSMVTIRSVGVMRKPGNTGINMRISAILIDWRRLRGAAFGDNQPDWLCLLDTLETNLPGKR